MKLSVLALDYDGTIARDDVLDPGVREAIAGARTEGIVTLLVTGRILDELRRVAGPLHFIDGVVAENGAVLYLPESRHLSLLAPPIPASFVEELHRRGIPHVAGNCLVDADAREAPRLLDVIREFELPLVLAFNGGRVMTLAQGISKATGLQAALDTLRLSPRNAVAIGDRENDHELLRLAEVGAAVEWGSAVLAAVADLVIPGSGPAATGAFIRELAAGGQMPKPARARRRLRLGYTEDGRELSLAVRGRNVLVAGDAKSGKSWVAGLLCEQLILQGYCVCVLDPEGDYRSLEALPGVTVLGGEDPPPKPRDLLRALRYPDRSLVIDLSRLPQDQKIEYIRAALPALNVMRRKTGLPHRILLDEAHYFLHDGDVGRLLDLEMNGYTIVTYCASKLPPDLLAHTEVMLVTCESNPVEIEALRSRCSGCGPIDRSRWSLLGHLKPGQAVVLPMTEEAGGELRLFTLGPRITPHVRHREKYVDVPVTDGRAFVFQAGDQPPRRARTLREFVAALAELPQARLDPYIGRHDFSRWVHEVFGDRALADELREIEAQHGAAWQVDTVGELIEAVRGRYDLTGEGEDLLPTEGVPVSPGLQPVPA